MRVFNLLSFFFVILFIFSSCKDEGNDAPDMMGPPIDTMQVNPMDTIPIDFGCIYEYDDNGLALNNCMDDEWQVDLDFSEDELTYLNFGDTLDFQGASIGTLDVFRPFPNPASDVIYFNYSITTNAYCKLVFLDEDYKREFIWHGLLNSDTQNFGLNISELINQNYRVYYSFSSDGNEDFAGGFGDVSIQN